MELIEINLNFIRTSLKKYCRENRFCVSGNVTTAKNQKILCILMWHNTILFHAFAVEYISYVYVIKNQSYAVKILSVVAVSSINFFILSLKSTLLHNLQKKNTWNKMQTRSYLLCERQERFKSDICPQNQETQKETHRCWRNEANRAYDPIERTSLLFAKL